MVGAVFLPIPETANSVKERGSNRALRSQPPTFFDDRPALTRCVIHLVDRHEYMR
jgi:hypothetical protein